MRWSQGETEFRADGASLHMHIPRFKNWGRLGLLVTVSSCLTVALHAQQNPTPPKDAPAVGPQIVQQGPGSPGGGAGGPVIIRRGPGGPGGLGGPGGPGQRIVIGGPGGPPEVYPEAKAMPQPKNDAELAAAIKTLAAKLAEDGKFSGSVIWAKDGVPLVNGAWGFADQNRGNFGVGFRLQSLSL